ncbi:LolA family protein [Melioribacter sp. OK-6-Me]|uniref:LolA family protein n=1 Tax=unclassified Melioribacter TaxID=2627329 RepID=UPI003EDB15B4
MMRSLILLLCFVTNLFAQKLDANEILNKVVEKFERVKDYEVDLTITTDLQMVKMPEMKLKIFFKQPDKLKISSKGFAMVPKDGVNLNPLKFLKGDYSTVYVKNEKDEEDEKINLDVIKIIPLSDTADYILSTIWVDRENHLVKKLESVTRRGINVTSKFYYKNTSYALPSKVVINLNEGSADKSKKEEEKSFRQSLSGKVVLTYSDYKINQGLKDEFFK